MKLLIGMTRSDTVLSGSFVHIRQVGEHMRSQGHEVMYLLGGEDGPASQMLRSCGFNVMQVESLRRSINPLHDCRAFVHVLRLIKQFKPDFCSWHTAKVGAVGRLACALLRVPCIYVAHGVSFAETPENPSWRLYAALERIASFLPGRIVCVCEYDQREFLKIGVNKDRLRVIRNGMKDPGPLARKTSGGHIRFVTAARYERQKDYRTLAHACRLLDERGVKFELDIYGQGPLKGEVYAYFEGLDNVNFKGVVPDFGRVLKDSDVFVLSTHWEGLPRSIIEAMSYSVPVIATDVGGVSELISSGSSGYLVPHEDPMCLADRMEHYCLSGYDIQKHGEEGYRLFSTKYCATSMLKAYEMEYHLGRTSPIVSFTQ